MFSFTIEDARYGSDAKRGAAGTEERISASERGRRPVWAGAFGMAVPM
jgi:hypothetical protein